MLRIRLKIWMLMTTVTIVAISLVTIVAVSSWMTRMTKQAAHFHRIALIYGASEQSCQQIEVDTIKSSMQHEQWALELVSSFGEIKSNEERNAVMSQTKDYREAVYQRQEAAMWGARADYYAREKQKYQRAAKQPWVSVPPDPHMPSMPFPLRLPRDGVYENN